LPKQSREKKRIIIKTEELEPARAQIPTLENIDEKKLVKLIKMVDKKAICKPC